MYSTDKPGGSSHDIWYIAGVTIAHGLALCMLLFILNVIEPGYEALFNTFQLAVPQMTIQVIELSHAVRDVGVGIVVIAMAIDVVVLWALRTKLSSAKWLAGVWSLCWMLLIVACQAFIGTAFWLPISRLGVALAK